MSQSTRYDEYLEVGFTHNAHSKRGEGEGS